MSDDAEKPVYDPQRGRELLDIGIRFAEALRDGSGPQSKPFRVCEKRLEELWPLDLREVGELICCIADRCDQLDQRGAFAPEAPEDGPLGFANVVTRRAELAAKGIIEPSGEVRDGQLVWVVTELGRMMGDLRYGREN